METQRVQYIFLSAPDERLKCAICGDIAVEAKQHDVCGKLFCKHCLEKQQENECVSCKAPNPRYFNDKRSQREIKSLEVECGSTGCDWNGMVSTLEKHKSECDFTLVSCTNNCMANPSEGTESGMLQRVRRQDLNHHLCFECPKRQYQCTKCRKEGQYADITGNHTNYCSMTTILCPSKECSVKYHRKDEDEHLKSCEYTAITCEYDSFGCSVKKMRREMSMHIEKDCKHHLSCALNKIRELKDTIDELKDALSSLEGKHTPTLTEGSNMTFRVTGLEARKANNMEYRSKQFYLYNQYGHKLCIVLYPNGILGQFQGHLSVTAMSSQFPVVKLDNFKLKIELLNQSADTHKHYALLSPNKSQTLWDVTKLISHEDLYQSFEYVKNDSLFLRVTISKLDLMGCALELDVSSLAQD